jgi:hypothetical protein
VEGALTRATVSQSGECNPTILLSSLNDSTRHLYP